LKGTPGCCQKVTSRATHIRGQTHTAPSTIRHHQPFHMPVIRGATPTASRPTYRGR
jgi:hypothetical protein